MPWCRFNVGPLKLHPFPVCFAKGFQASGDGKTRSFISSHHPMRVRKPTDATHHATNSVDIENIFVFTSPPPVVVATRNIHSKRIIVESVAWDGDSAAKTGMVSAASEVQWPQARRCKVARWNLTDTRCQLCLVAIGTEEHRFCCCATSLAGGWPVTFKTAAGCLGRLGIDRKRLF